MESGKIVCYQFSSDLGIPIFVRFNQDVVGVQLVTFLENNRFTLIPEKEISQIDKFIQETDNARLLNIELASAHVARQIRAISFTDSYGAESVTPRDGYRIYRYKNVAVTIFSHRSRMWEMGVLEGFGESGFEARVVINRFLAWALAPMGMISFWGVPVDEGIVILKQRESEGEWGYVDAQNLRQISLDGVKEHRSSFEILRLDPVLKVMTIVMIKVELLSFLYHYCVYFEHNGLSYPIRQMIHHLSRLSFGHVYPEENFRPRTDLSV
jgi:hypothetical protein